MCRPRDWPPSTLRSQSKEGGLGTIRLCRRCAGPPSAGNLRTIRLRAPKRRRSRDDPFVPTPRRAPKRGRSRDEPFVPRLRRVSQALSVLQRKERSMGDPFVPTLRKAPKRGRSRDDPFVPMPRRAPKRGRSRDDPSVPTPRWGPKRGGSRGDPFVPTLLWGRSNCAEPGLAPKHTRKPEEAGRSRTRRQTNGRSMCDPFVPTLRKTPKRGRSRDDPFVPMPRRAPKRGRSREDPFVPRLRRVFQAPEVLRRSVCADAAPGPQALSEARAGREV